MGRFHNALYLGDARERLRILEEAGALGRGGARGASVCCWSQGCPCLGLAAACPQPVPDRLSSRFPLAPHHPRPPAGQTSLAYVTAATHGLTEDAERLGEELGELRPTVDAAHGACLHVPACNMRFASPALMPACTAFQGASSRSRSSPSVLPLFSPPAGPPYPRHA